MAKLTIQVVTAPRRRFAALRYYAALAISIIAALLTGAGYDHNANLLNGDDK